MEYDAVPFDVLDVDVLEVPSSIRSFSAMAKSCSSTIQNCLIVHYSYFSVAYEVYQSKLCTYFLFLSCYIVLP